MRANIHKKARKYSWVYVKQYCAKIDEAARNRMELIVRSLAEQNGVTEQLKAENQMEWVRQMNACKAQAEEIVKIEWYNLNAKLSNKSEFVEVEYEENQKFALF